MDLRPLPGYLSSSGLRQCVGPDRLSLCTGTASSSPHSPSTNHRWQERNSRARLYNRTAYVVMEPARTHWSLSRSREKTPPPQTPGNFPNFCPPPNPNSWTLHTLSPSSLWMPLISHQCKYVTPMVQILVRTLSVSGNLYQFLIPSMFLCL